MTTWTTTQPPLVQKEQPGTFRAKKEEGKMEPKHPNPSIWFSIHSAECHNWIQQESFQFRGKQLAIARRL